MYLGYCVCIQSCKTLPEIITRDPLTGSSHLALSKINPDAASTKKKNKHSCDSLRDKMSRIVLALNDNPIYTSN